MPLPIWLDCDPGNDDAVAILLAAKHPAFRLKGILTVHGNASLAETTINALGLLEMLGFEQDEIPVYAGAAAPLRVPPQYALDVHGKGGLGGIEFPASKLKASTDKGYLEAMRDAILAEDGKMCLVCTGAMTNYAQLVGKYPEIRAKLRCVSMMGGALSCGNITPHAEFNMYADPDAAKIVLEDPELAEKTILAPLNVTHTAMATPKVLALMKPEQLPLRKTFAFLSNYAVELYSKRYGIDIPGTPVHDPLALFITLPFAYENETDPELADLVYRADLHYLQKRVEVLQDDVKRGATVVLSNNLDVLGKEKGGACFAQGVNIPLFWKFILEALDNADRGIKFT